MKTDHITGGTQATHATKRLGRGRGNGRGKTCCRGHKGSGQRSGYSTKPGFEGGQMPLYRRLPQRGFNNANFGTEYSVVNLGDLSKVDGTVVDKASLVKAGLVRSNAALIKILGDGEVTTALTVKVDKISKSAAAKIEAAGGTLDLLPPPPVAPPRKKWSPETDQAKEATAVEPEAQTPADVPAEAEPEASEEVAVAEEALTEESSAADEESTDKQDDPEDAPSEAGEDAADEEA